jgi:Na+-driven multidrug efflux pump
VQVILIIALLPCSRLLADLFSKDEEVADLIAKLIPLSCIFMLGDAFQANTGGAMRGKEWGVSSFATLGFTREFEWVQFVYAFVFFHNPASPGDNTNTRIFGYDVAEQGS